LANLMQTKATYMAQTDTAPAKTDLAITDIAKTEPDKAYTEIPKLECSINGDYYEIRGDKIVLFALKQAWEYFGAIWKSETQVDIKRQSTLFHPQQLLFLAREAHYTLNPLPLKTRCGKCGLVGHNKMTCKGENPEEKEQAMLTRQHPLYRKFYTSAYCMCGPVDFPSICFFCKGACCDQAQQLTIHDPHILPCLKHQSLHKK